MLFSSKVTRTEGLVSVAPTPPIAESEKNKNNGNLIIMYSSECDSDNYFNLPGFIDMFVKGIPSACCCAVVLLLLMGGTEEMLLDSTAALLAGGGSSSLSG